MNRYTKTRLYAALAGAGITVATGAQAVQLSSDGRGQVLLYPYYTTRTDFTGNAFATLVSVVNTTPSAKAVGVRFLEGKNSRQVVDFNLFLSPFDVWTAAVLPDTTSGGTKIGTLDLSCTLPSFSTVPTPPFYPFNNFEYSGEDADGAETGLDRTREGHFEIIEMATYTSTSITGKAVTHVNALPPCGANLTNMQATTDAQPPSGGLFGTATLINVNSGTDYTFDAVALSNFYQGGANYQPAQQPDVPDLLTQATPPLSSIHAPDGRLYESTWATGTADAVSAVLMHDSVMNDFVLDTATKSQTDWVMTMPTKRFYVSPGSGNAPKLFQRNFSGTAGSCDDLQLDDRDLRPYIYDREERTRVPDIIIGLPRPPGFMPRLCWTASVLTFNDNGVVSTVFGSPNSTSITTRFQNGWLNVEMLTVIPGTAVNVHKLINVGATSISARGQATTGNTVTYVGLPVIGFAAMSFTNGTLVVGGQNVLSNYGGNFVHKMSTLIQ